MICLIFIGILVSTLAHAQNATNATYSPKVDVHSHFLPDFYSQALRDAGYISPHGPDGAPGFPNWTVDAHLALKNELNIRKSYISISTPGVHLKVGDLNGTISLAQRVNNFAANLTKVYPDRFGFFASLPLPDVNASLAEIDRAVGLGANGFALLTNYDSIYLGDPRFDTVFQKLNEVNAVIFMHPTSPYVCSCTNNSIPQSADQLTLASPLKYGRPAFEFLLETGRTCVNLLVTNTVSKNSNLKFILPHMGGAFPALVDRIRGQTGVLLQGGPSADEILQLIKDRFWFDCAGYQPLKHQYKTAFEFASLDHILYGSDSPWTARPVVVQQAQYYEGDVKDVFSPLGQQYVDGAYYKNAQVLLG